MANDFGGSTFTQLLHGNDSIHYADQNCSSKCSLENESQQYFFTPDPTTNSLATLKGTLCSFDDANRLMTAIFEIASIQTEIDGKSLPAHGKTLSEEQTSKHLHPKNDRPNDEESPASPIRTSKSIHACNEIPQFHTPNINASIHLGTANDLHENPNMFADRPIDLFPPPTVEELELEFYKELEYETERERQSIDKRNHTTFGIKLPVANPRIGQRKGSLPYRFENYVEGFESIDLPRKEIYPSSRQDGCLLSCNGDLNMDDKFIPEQIVTSFGSFEGNEHIVEAIAEKDSQRIWSRLAREGLEKEVGLKRLHDSEQCAFFIGKVTSIQRVSRGFLGRRIARRERLFTKEGMQRKAASILIQRWHRGVVGRVAAEASKFNAINHQQKMSHSIAIQRRWRGWRGRHRAALTRRSLFAVQCQRLLRGHQGRCAANHLRQCRDHILKQEHAAARIQCLWRIKVSVAKCLLHQSRQVAATHLQRIIRGCFARKELARMCAWSSTEPGLARIEMGLKWIQEAEGAFESHQHEIDSLHRAEEVAKSRMNHIGPALKKSQEEFDRCNKELESIETVEKEFIKISKAKASNGNSKIADYPGRFDAVAVTQTNDIAQGQRKLPLTLKRKRALAAVTEKRLSLEKLQSSMTQPKDARKEENCEFKRIQRDLMQLLNNEKLELNRPRTERVQLETATAATEIESGATTQMARNHELQTSRMYRRHEELIKFQFMSMSLSYASSLGMLKQMKKMASNATASAALRSVDAISLAAGVVDTTEDRPKINRGTRTQQLSSEVLMQHPLPGTLHSTEPLSPDCRKWTVGDVSRWLKDLNLGAYIDKFTEASVDGAFLLELEEEDIAGILGMQHKLHRRKLILARYKLRSFLRREKGEEFVSRCYPIASASTSSPSDMLSSAQNLTDVDVAFSHARHCRLRRLEESLNEGFNINSEDNQGNSLLMIAVQNGHMKAVALLAQRGSSLDHTNINGNTALHYALAYDTTGEIATYLIEQGADDTIENHQGLSAYDGLGDDPLQSAECQNYGQHKHGP